MLILILQGYIKKKPFTKNKYDPITKNKLSTQAVSIKYELFKLIKLKKVTKSPKNVIEFLNKRYYTYSIKTNKIHTYTQY